MKTKLFLAVATFVFSTSAFANVSELSCYLLDNNHDMDNALVITRNELLPDGSVVVTEADTWLTGPKQTRFAFTVKVENNVITSMRLEDKVDGIISEQTDLRRENFMEINLQSKDLSSKLLCFLNII